MKKLWKLGIAAATLTLSSFAARASVTTLDWSTVTQGTLQHTGNLYTTGNDFSGAKITVAGSDTATPFPFTSAGLQTPAVTDTIFQGGSPSPISNLSTVALFKPSGGPITYTIDFFGFKQGVTDVNFKLFDVDTSAHTESQFVDVITFNTAGLTLTPGADNMVSADGKTVTGTLHATNLGAGSGDGNVSVQSGNLPLHEIVFTYSSLPENLVNLHGFGIGNISFTPVPEVGQLAIGLVACLLGALWLNGRRHLVSTRLVA